MNELVQQLNALRTTEPQARFRALLPTIDALVQQGVSHVKLVDTLTNVGLPIRLGAFQKALYRWRKQSGKVPKEGTPQDNHPTLGSRQKLSIPTTPFNNPPSNGIQSKADLVRLRNSDPIDLDSLAEYGRKK